VLSRLQINQVRNLQHITLQDLRRVNVFFGRNGSGKTSVLESIHLLGMARSFRGTGIKALITHGQTSATVFGEVASPSSPAGKPLGVTRNISGEVQIKVGGNPVRTVAQLVESLVSRLGCVPRGTSILRPVAAIPTLHKTTQ
jgi:DNA replication and repair protein RecF